MASDVGDGQTLAASGDGDAVRPTTIAAPGRRRRRRWLWIGGIALLIAGAAAGWGVGQQVRSPEQAASSAAEPDASWITAPVEHRTLAQTVIIRGDAHPQVAVPVNVPSSIEGEPVVTAIGVAAGGEVTDGSRLLEVSGRPVFVFEGDVPIYRSLMPGMSGDDVLQLQASLARIGCDSAADGDVYGSATKACIATFYTAAGYQPIPTSPTEASDLSAARQTVDEAQAAVDAAELTLQAAQAPPSEDSVFAADSALRAARRGYDDTVASGDAAVAQAEDGLVLATTAVEALRAAAETSPTDLLAAENGLRAAEASLDEAERSRESAIAAASDSLTMAQAARDALDTPPDVTAEFIALGQAIAARDRSQSALAALESATGPIVAQGEIVFAPALPARVEEIVATLGPIGAGVPADGQPATASTGLAQLAAGELVVSTRLDVAEHGLVRIGMTVDLLDEQSNLTYPATVTEMAEAPSTGDDGQVGYATVITPVDPLPAGLGGANLRVTITAAATEAASLVVPVAAVSSAADGTTFVAVVAPDQPPEADPIRVPIVTGLSADGFVAVEATSAGTLAAGDRVVVGR